ncbi:pyrroline-5-carboxylate reductase [Candidatus Magnetominusculus xianensis]|uniref:Pyrroline-5-carboxylate reductase n=1 Tax=Candidatus Magnetominusculus xianensis TaxID=1748249 RepID=A0ABR5SF80_9BACT|nr:pyrroline-5-carboxylate reductase [Candidatus Magnetominusculus xianensis]KWT85773.1 pyrroline-5-carboxylate reductase [Candidatus Magnetominusculus xianensis]MBF0405270.1 pyrroline-5-carboxylate reductase [Nitrospirota bacterium]
MIGFIGGGNMAEALIKGIRGTASKDIYVSEPNEQRRLYLKTTYGVDTTGNNMELAASSDIIVIAVKPQVISALADEFSGTDLSKKTIVSIAAGVSISNLRQAFRTETVIRVMPNTPALVLKGMSVISAAEGISPETIDKIDAIFSSIGEILHLPEAHMDAVTAVSGSGPAFISFFVQGMIEGGIALGLDGQTASALAIQTLAGTSELLASHSPEAIIKMVSSPGGTTVAGLKVMQDRDAAGLIADVLRAAAIRSAELNIKLKGQ